MIASIWIRDSAEVRSFAEKLFMFMVFWFDPLPPLTFPYVINLLSTFLGAVHRYLSGNKEATRKSCGLQDATCASMPS